MIGGQMSFSGTIDNVSLNERRFSSTVLSKRDFHPVELLGPSVRLGLDPTLPG